MLQGAELQARLGRLGAFLEAHESLWRPRPFAVLRCPWEDPYPELAGWLRERTLDESIALDRMETSDFPEPLGAWARRASELSDLPAWEAVAPVAPVRVRQQPARKRAQIRAFSAMVRPDASPIVEWCAGKAYLGRSLALRDGAPAVAVEVRPELCRAAETLAAEDGIGLDTVCADVCTDDGARALRPGARVVALHACGHLTDALFDAAGNVDIDAVYAAPCCCHRIVGEIFEPRSSVGSRHDLRLTSADLRLATAEEVSLSPARMVRRRREMAWRLGLDLLLRQSGASGYTAVPRMGRAVVRLPFEAFVARMSAEHGLTLPARWDPVAAEEAGWERARVVRGLTLVRSVFRRPLELFCWLDRALALQEAGWKVQIGLFCERQVTPRNVLVVARRDEGDGPC